MYTILEHYSYFVPPRPQKEHYSDGPLLDHVFYINLDHRTDRKADLEQELNAMGLTYERFPAIRHTNGAVGCAKSHLAVWKLAKERNYKRILVLEDDFTFMISKSQWQEELEDICSVPFDVCMIAYNTMSASPTEYPFVQKIHDAQTLSGYMINMEYMDKLIDIIEPSIPLLEKTGRKELYAIDMAMKPLQKTGVWYHTTTRIGTQKASFSDIEQHHVNYNV